MWGWVFLGLLLLGMLAFMAGIASLVQGWRFARRVRDAARLPEADSPAAAILAPMRGADPGLAVNLDGLLTQRYGTYRVIFAVDSLEDPAVAVIQAAMARHRVPAILVVSPGPRGGSGKSAALARAAEALTQEDRIVVTWDADARPHARWLASLVGGLGEGIGATTGYRWYTSRGGFWSAVRAGWVASGFNILFNDRYNFCWGGSTAVRRELFDSAGIREKWPASLSDDLVITFAVKERGLRVRFLPRAVCVTDEPCDRRTALAWTTQQSAIVYAYFPKLTSYALGAYAVFDGAVVLGILSAVLAVAVAPAFALAAALFLLDLPITAIKAEQRRRVLASALPEWREVFAADRGRFLLASLVVPWVMILNLWRVRRLTAISWRGRTYPMPSPRKP